MYVKKKLWKGIPINFTHLFQEERISIIQFYSMYSYEVPNLVE